MIPAVDIQHVEKHFGALRALKGIDLQIPQGEFFALLGPNGAGKSTLINLLAGLLRPSTGKMRIMGHDNQQNYMQARRVLGVVPQELVFDPFFKLREMLRFQAGYFGLGKENHAWIDQVIEALGLTDKANTNMRRLSGGMKRRALIAQAVVHKPPVIVLDEPTAGVDVELRHMLWAFIRDLNQQGHTIILTTHYLEEAEALCSRVGIMKAGQIVALDSTANLLSQATGKQLCIRTRSPRVPHALLPLLKQQTDTEWYFDLSGVAEVTYVLDTLRAEGVAVEDMTMRAVDLEQVFMRLVARTDV